MWIKMPTTVQYIPKVVLFFSCLIFSFRSCLLLSGEPIFSYPRHLALCDTVAQRLLL